MIELTLEQRQGLAADDNLLVIDPDTKAAYVLVRKEAFDKMKSLLALDDYNPDEGLAHMNEVMSDDDAHDPLLESYQRYRETES